MLLRWIQFWHPERQFRHYLEDVLEVATGNDGHGYRTPAARKILLSVSAIIAILTVKCAQFTWLCLSAHLSDFVRVLNHDMTWFFESSPLVNVFAISFDLQLIYFYYRGYWFARNKKEAMPISLIYNIFNQNDFALHYFPSRVMKQGSKVTVEVKIRRYILLYIWLFQYCLAFFGKKF